MNGKPRCYLRIASALLVLGVFLAGQMQATTASGTHQGFLSARVLQGNVIFPRLAVAAPAPDGATLALYLVEGNTATVLATLEGTRAGVHHAIAQLSPDGRYVACLRTEGDDLRPVLETIDTQAGQRFIVAEESGDAHDRETTAEMLLTSVVWMDAERLLYSRVWWPSNEEWTASREAGTPLSIRGEVWLSSVDGAEQRLLAAGTVYRVLGASSEGATLYVTRLIPGREEDREEGFALLDVTSGEMENLWPQEERAVDRFHSFQLVTLPNGTRRLLFATAERGDTAPGSPPVIWAGDVESGQAEAIWTIDRGADWSWGEIAGTIYDIPRTFLWSPRSEREFVYLADGAALGGVWRVDLDAGTANSLGALEPVKRTGLHLLAWTSEGIVVQNQDALWLVDEDGEVRGEIRFREETPGAPAQVLGIVVDHAVPYVHQIYDMPAWFNGLWACGPTSAVMALAYYRRLPVRTEGYGWYVPDVYTYRSACSGENTFDRAVHEYAPPYPPPGSQEVGWGAYGAGTEEQWDQTEQRWEAYAVAWRLQAYARQHDVASVFDSNPTYAEVEAELRGGAVVLLDTNLTPDHHIVVVRGYTDDKPTQYIVNDPYGDRDDGYPNHNGNGARYTWEEMSPIWYIALYGPLYLPDLNKPANSTDNSVITVYNGAQLSWQYADDVSVCLVNTGGDLNRVVQAPFSIPPHGSWQLSLSDQFSWWEAFSGAATVMVNRPGALVVVSQRRGNSYAATPGIPVGETNDTVHLPVVARASYGGWYTAFRVQNTGTQATTVRADYYRENGTYVGTVDKTVSPNGSVDFDQSDGDHDFGIGSYSGSAVVTSLTPGVPLAVHVREWYQSTPQFISYAGFSAGVTTLSMPVLFNRGYGTWSASFSLRNLGPAYASVIIRFEPSGSSTYRCTDYRSISASFTAWLPSYPPSPPYQYCSFPTGWTGSATVTSSQPLVGVVYEDEETTYRLGGYESIASGSTMVVLPYLPNDYENTNASFSIQNLGASPTNIGISYYRSDGTAYIDNNTYSISAGSSRAWYLPQVPPALPGGWLYAAVIVSKSEPIGGMVNVINPYYTSDRFTSYSGDNR